MNNEETIDSHIIIDARFSGLAATLLAVTIEEGIVMESLRNTADSSMAFSPGKQDSHWFTRQDTQTYKDRFTSILRKQVRQWGELVVGGGSCVKGGWRVCSEGLLCADLCTSWAVSWFSWEQKIEAVANITLMHICRLQQSSGGSHACTWPSCLVWLWSCWTCWLPSVSSLHVL